MSLDNLTFAKRYSKALFQLLKDNNELNSGYQELTQLREVFNDTPALVSALNNVSFPEANKKSLIQPLIDNATSKYIKNLINVVFECGYIGDMVLLINQFEDLYDQYNKITHAEVTTAVQLDDQQLDKLKQSFAKRIGAKKIVLKTKVDQNIIGGLIVKTSNVVFDGSVKSKIRDVRQLLMN